MANTIPEAFFAYPSRVPTLKEAIDVAVPELNRKRQVKIKTWEQCNIGGKFVIDTICNAIDEAQLFFADLTGLNANVMFELGYAIACGKRIWLILDDTYTEAKNMFDQLKILTTVGYVSCCNSQNIVSGFYENNPVEDMENTIFRTAIEPILTPSGSDSILYLKSQHENQAALHMTNLLQERFPEKIIVDAPNKPAVQSLADYGNLVFGCNGLICHFTNPEREGAHVQNVRQALVCGMAHGFEKPLLMLAEGEFLPPIDYRDFLQHYDTAPQALGYLKEWLLGVDQDLKVDGDRSAGIRDPLSEPHVEQDLKADQEAAVAPQKIFITYAHQDTEAQKKLKTYLAVMEDEGKIELWDDNKILPGDEWEKDIPNNLVTSDILLYLVSATSLASKNCSKELAEALSANIRVIPIILESCDWLNDRLSDFQALPDKGEPINKWDTEEDGWQNVVDGIREAIEEMQTQSNSLSETSEKELRAELAFQHGNVFMMIGQINMAIEHYSHAIELNPNNASTYNNRGVAYGKKGDYDRAIGDYIQAIQLKPDFVEAYCNLGGVYCNKDDFDRAIEECNKAIDLNPNFADAYNSRGTVYYKKGDIDRAIIDFNMAMRLNPNHAGAYNNRGLAYSDKGDIDHAIVNLTKAIQLKSDFAEAYYNRGNAYSNKNDFDYAIGDNNTAIALKPNYTNAYYNRGLTYSNKGDIDHAIVNLTKAIQLKSDFAEAYYNRGNAYSNKNDFDYAIGDYTRAIELNPNYTNAYYNRGLTYSDKGETDRAIGDYTRAIELNPNCADAYSNRGNVYSDKGDFDRAIRDHTKAIELNPNYAELYYNRGVAYREQGDIDRAIEDFTKAIQLKPDYVEAYYNRGGGLPQKRRY